MHRDSDPATPEQQEFLDALEAGEVTAKVAVEDSVYLIIHGRTPHTNKTMVDYVDHIIYGAPKQINAVELEGSHFVALVEYPKAQFNWAYGTMERMASFPFGASLVLEQGRKAALMHFGSWVYHYSKVKTFEYMSPETPPVD
jgi:hypothetical protein